MSVAETILRRAQAGERPAQIARALDIPPPNVHRILSDARASGVDLPRFPPGRRPVAVKIRARALAGLEPDAAARGITISQLVHQLIEVIAREGMVTAVLDDMEERKG